MRVGDRVRIVEGDHRTRVGSVEKISTKYDVLHIQLDHGGLVSVRQGSVHLIERMKLYVEGQKTGGVIG